MLLDGHKVAKKIIEELKVSIHSSAERPPCLACILATKNPASHTYVGRKVKACHELGIQSRVYNLDPVHNEELLSLIDNLNSDPTVDGILVQLPLPPRIHLLDVIERIDPKKDVDGFHPLNVGKMLIQDPSAFYSCTPFGIKVLLESYDIEVKGKHVVILGRSNIVGKPLASLLLQNAPGCNATVTVAHSHSHNLKEITRSADILIAAIGKPKMVGPEMIKEKAVVIDVGINKVEDVTAKNGFRIVGDVDFDAVRSKCSAITPVPGGIGPMTIAMLLKNTVTSYLRSVGK